MNFIQVSSAVDGYEFNRELIFGFNIPFRSSIHSNEHLPLQFKRFLNPYRKTITVTLPVC